MLALRSCLRKVLAPRVLAPQVYSSFATGPRQTEGTFYEFCTYYLKPSKMKEFMHNFKQNVHLRTAHSELVGYWRVEFGGRIDRVFHIWKYDNFAHRAAVAKALANDTEWQERFLIPNLASIDEQESEITYLVPWCKIGTPPEEERGLIGKSSYLKVSGFEDLSYVTENVTWVVVVENCISRARDHWWGGVYELVSFLMKPGGPALWGEAFERAVNAHVNQGYSKLIGVFHSEYGTLNRVHVLWWSQNADSRAAGRHRAHEDPRVVSAGELVYWAGIVFRTRSSHKSAFDVVCNVFPVRESVNYLDIQQNMFLIPESFSPLR